MIILAKNIFYSLFGEGSLVVVCINFVKLSGLIKYCPLSCKNSAPVGELCTSVLNTIGCTSMCSLTDINIPFTEGVFLWTTRLCIFVRPSASSVFLVQWGFPIPLLINLTKCNLGKVWDIVQHVWCLLISALATPFYDITVNPPIRAVFVFRFHNSKTTSYLKKPSLYCIMSDTEDRQSPPQTSGRHEKSLGLLTTKFVELLQSAEGGILDLKKVRTEEKTILSAILAVTVIAGCRHAGGKTEKAHLRHYQCFRGHRFDRERVQK